MKNMKQILGVLVGLVAFSCAFFASQFADSSSNKLRELSDNQIVKNKPTKPKEPGIKQSAVEEVKNKDLPVASKDMKSSVPAKTQEESKATAWNYRRGNDYLKKYAEDKQVRQIVLVEQNAGEKNAGTLYLLTKDNLGKWQETLQCEAFLGRNGINKTREGDAKTPTGDYGFSLAFGVKDNPGALIKYLKVTPSMYVCGDKEYYNEIVDTNVLSHNCSSASEHLIDYVPQYNYALFIDYNKGNAGKGEYGKGSAIFLHCFGSYRYTLGCISVSETNILKILKTVDRNARICIYPYQ